MIKTFYLTDVGRVRSHNEDNVSILKNDNGEYLLCVADGMGGHRKGEVASSMTIDGLGKKFKALKTLGSKIDAANWINDNIKAINTEIFDYAAKHEDSFGMGTTVVLAILTKDYLLFGNIGDSTGYVLKNNRIHRVTKPHTLVNMLVEAGEITPEEARNHPKRNVLMRALGVAETVDIDIFDVDTCDAILLASDGLTNMLTDDQIEKVLNDEELTAEEKVKKLIRKCNARGGPDNISAAYLMSKGDVK